MEKYGKKEGIVVEDIAAKLGCNKKWTCKVLILVKEWKYVVILKTRKKVKWNKQK